MKNMIGAHHDAPRRKSIRLKNYDYSSPGYYFITVCAQNREHLFGEIINEKMKLNHTGKIIQNIWESLPNHHPVELDTFQIMPNHVHFIIELLPIVRAPQSDSVRAPQRRPTQRGGKRELLPIVIGYLKMNTTKQIRRLLNDPHKSVWQRNYYEHIIRTENDLNKIREYIHANPNTWDTDKNNIKKL